MPTKKILQTLHDDRPSPYGRRLRLDFGLDGGERIPAILTLPATPEPARRAPAALLLHGGGGMARRQAVSADG